MANPLYRLKKSRNILRHTFSLYKKRWKQLREEQLKEMEKSLASLDEALLNHDREKASTRAQDLEKFAKKHLKKSPLDHARELLFAFCTALIIATIVRQMWFEPMEIPTGSMRPTFKEKDRLIVSKMNFGLNVPLKAKHFIFNPSSVKRTGIFIFRPENMDIQDTDTTYFGLPGKKRFIKRCMGVPGDILYFYGGKIYGIDKFGNEIKELRESSSLEGLEHIPFIDFEGKVLTTAPNARGLYSPVFYYQMNQLIAKHSFHNSGKTYGEIYVDNEWKLESSSQNKNSIQSYSDFWGIKNYAMARLMTKQELMNFSQANTENLEDAPLYLEIRHTPSLSSPNSKIIRDKYARIRPVISTNISVIPLQQNHLDAMMASLYTSRFTVKDGYAQRYTADKQASMTTSILPQFSDVPDGKYEFYYGKGHSIGWGGETSPLPKDHPLYEKNPKSIQKLFNLGIAFFNGYSPHSKDQPFFPSRYAYFRDGDLYLLGTPILKKDDPTLIAFLHREQHLEEIDPQYRPFKDFGAPLKNDGTIDKHFIETFGMKIPEGMFLALGDNHAASSDSRDFGFVPQNNIRGSAGPILWPLGHRWGSPPQAPLPWLTIPSFIVYFLIFSISALSFFLYKKRLNKPIFKKLSP